MPVVNVDNPLSLASKEDTRHVLVDDFTTFTLGNQQPGKQLFLTGFTFSVQKTAVSTGSDYDLEVLINGAFVPIASIILLDGNIGHGDMSSSLDYPIEIDNVADNIRASVDNTSQAHVRANVRGVEI